MANNFDKGMDDAYLGNEPDENATIEYLQGYGYAESLYEKDEQQPEQPDNRVQEYSDEQLREHEIEQKIDYLMGEVEHLGNKINEIEKKLENGRKDN